MIDPYDTRFNQKLLCLAECDPVGVPLLDRFASLFGRTLDEDNKCPDEWYVFADLVEREYERKAADLNLVLNSPFEIGSWIKPTSLCSYIDRVGLYALPVVGVDYCVRGHILSGTPESGTKWLYLSADLTTPKFVERQDNLRYHVVPRSWFRDEEWSEYLVGSRQRKLEVIGVIFDRETENDPALRMFQLMSFLYKNSQESILDIIDIFVTDPITRAYSRRIS